MAHRALLIGMVVPFTLIVIKPTNDRLLAAGRDLASADTRALLERWGRLHAVRSLFSALSTVVMLWQLSRPDRYSAFAPVSRTTLPHFTSRSSRSPAVSRSGAGRRLESEPVQPLADVGGFAPSGSPRRSCFCAIAVGVPGAGRAPPGVVLHVGIAELVQRRHVGERGETLLDDTASARSLRT